MLAKAVVIALISHFMTIVSVSSGTQSWSGMTSDGRSAIQLGTGKMVTGVRCRGRYCDDMYLEYESNGRSTSRTWWTNKFSEEGTNQATCGTDGWVTGLECSGRYCDNVKLRCTRFSPNIVRAGCYWSAEFSEEDGGELHLPAGAQVNGMKCSGRYCDNIKLYVCWGYGSRTVSNEQTLAAKYAPRLRFDSKFGTGSGINKKCFPSSAASYYTARKTRGTSAKDLCNQNYNTISSNSVPAYYVAEQCDSSTVMIRYWLFSAWQSACFAYEGDHAADWEAITVVLKNGAIKGVAFAQHDGWYTKRTGNTEWTGNHPIGYSGKNSHGSYHEDGGIGGCNYWDDYRNPGSNNYRWDTWNNLVKVHRQPGAPDWMRCVGKACFDNIGHPLDRAPLCGMKGCASSGCGRSDIGSGTHVKNM